MENEKIYTQEDMDNISKKIKESQKAKYEKTHISLETYQDLEKKYNDLLEKDKVNGFKETFIANGGNADAYNDFISTNKDIMSLSGDKLTNKFKELKEQKPYFFSNQPKINSPINTPNDNEQMNDLFENDNSDLIDGTMYKKSSFKI